MSLIFTLVLLVITLSGSLWIMYHLKTNTMPLTPEQVRKLALRHQRHVHSRFRTRSSTPLERDARRLVASVGGRAGRHRRRRGHRAHVRVLRLLRLRHRLGAGVSRPSSSPSNRPCDATLLSFAVFALAFIARPIGTVLFMDIQRRWGRYTKLTLALFLLGIIHRRDRLPARVRRLGPVAIALLAVLPDRPGHRARRCLGRPAVAARADRAARQARLVRDDGAIGRADRLHHRQRALPVAVRDACRAKISWTGAGAIPSSAPSRSTWWPCSRAFGWWSPTNTTQLLTERELEPSPVTANCCAPAGHQRGAGRIRRARELCALPRGDRVSAVVDRVVLERSRSPNSSCCRSSPRSSAHRRHRRLRPHRRPAGTAQHRGHLCRRSSPSSAASSRPC